MTLGFKVDTINITNATVSTLINIGSPQHNHNFHRPSVYDSAIDVDTVDIHNNKFADGHILETQVFNMSNDLRVSFNIKCEGLKFINNGEDRVGLWDFPNSQVISTIYNPNNNSTTMRFWVTNNLTYYENTISEVTTVRLVCFSNRIFIHREAGTPGENLTYSVVVNDPSTIVTPVINIAKSVCNNNYCIQLLGSNFNATASVQVRENVNGSGILETYAGNDIYRRTPVGSEERIQFPIRNLIQQNKFNNNGLCFKVINSNSSSNEKCFVRPVTADQPPFMGQVVESYNAGQDKEHTSYVVVGSGGNKLKIWGNVWKKIASDYTVTPSTVLKFKFRSNQQQAEINGIGFIMNGSTSAASSRTWQVYGTQTNFGKQDFHDYVSSGTDAQWKEYIIPIGESFTGQISGMVFIADEDAHVGQNVMFKSPKLVEAPDQYDDVPYRRAYDDDVRERSVSWAAGTTQQFHNFHDAGDVDWTIVHAEGNIRFRTELLGSNADTKMSVYKWISGDYHPSGDGTFINLVDVLLGSDNSSGSSEYTILNGELAVYAIKVQSRNGTFGNNTDYKLIIDTPPNAFPDQYDNVPSQRAYDDDVRERSVSWAAGTTQQFHNFHDAGDVDWTIVHAEGNIRFRTELLGSNADTKMSVYKWISGDYHPSGDGTFINLVDVLLGSDNSSGSSEYTILNGELAVYAVKVESRIGALGAGTEYKLIIE
ncbi:hypothetical protein MNBD_GAMMA01-2026 [hydrothermal vent metagenome]|uniref:Uncharacterized protein n=1 Tax=hydrothermal vent metagenome TaxID=652676 RepID=A0A3B0VGF8_9ZZZZ